MKKWLSIALLLFSIAAPSATYSVDVFYNIQNPFMLAGVETKKADNLKPATLKRRFCAYLLCGAMVCVEAIIFGKIYNITIDKNLLGNLKKKWPYMVISSVTHFFFDLFSKYILNMKVVDISGKDASWIQLLIRHIFKLLDTFEPFIALLPGDIGTIVKFIYVLFSFLWEGIKFIVPLAREDRRNVYDLVAKTIVVMRDESTSDSNRVRWHSYKSAFSLLSR